MTDWKPREGCPRDTNRIQKEFPGRLSPRETFGLLFDPLGGVVAGMHPRLPEETGVL